MVSTIQIKPALLLQPFIRPYSFRIFNAGNLKMPRLMYAVLECYMTFFLQDKYCELSDDSNRLSKQFCNLITAGFQKEKKLH
jgi:hypothetical protein